MSAIDDILGKSGPGGDNAEAVAKAELYAFVTPPATYRPFLVRPRPQMALCIIEASGHKHGFMYHSINHPTHQMRGGEEFLTFTSEGIAIVMQGRRLDVLFEALLRHTLAEVRAYDGKAAAPGDPIIDRLSVTEPGAKQESMVRLVK